MSVQFGENRKTLFLPSKWRFDGISENKGFKNAKV
jgi:hypothetical protein